jgi:large subunit ribosomal protein L15
MKLSNLKPAKGSVSKRKRIARGPGSGHGGTSTRGHKGAKSRSGYSRKRGHEGGQMPIQMRLPKRGFKNTHRRYKSFRSQDYVVFNLSQLAAHAEKYNLEAIDTKTLYALGIIAKNDMYKVLADGELAKALEVSANRFSKSAKEAISKAGGKAFVTFKINQLQGIAEAYNLQKIGPKEIAQYFSHVEEGDLIHVLAEGSIKTKFDIEAHKVDDQVADQVKALGANVVVLN